MAENQKITPKLSERFSDLFDVDDLSSELSADEASSPVYLEESRKLSLNKLLHLAPYSEVLLLLGKQGVGKTTLLRAFIERVATTWRISSISATALMDGSAFLREIAGGFGLDLDVIGATEDLLWELNRYLQAVGRSGRRAIIIIDDAHLLNDDVILLIERILLDDRSDGSVSLLLSMRLDQSGKFDRFAILKERLAYSMTLEPFSIKEVEGYLRQRMAGNMAEFESRFTPEVIADLHQESGGMAEQINTLVHKVLAENKQLAKPRSRKPLLLGGMVGVVALVAAIVLFYQDEINQMLEVPTEPPLADGEVRDAVDLVASQDTAVVHLQDDESLPIPIPELEQEISTVLPQTPPADGVELGVLTETQASGPLVIEEQIAQTESATNATEKTVSEVETDSPEPIVNTEPALAPAPVEPELSPELKWLVAQPDSNYTLQLMALVDEKTVMGYVEKLDIAGQSAAFPATKRGKELIVLVSGSYASRAEATKAASEIPGNIGLGEPWIRSFASVRKDWARK